MDNGDQIQQTNLVSDDTAAAMDGVQPAPQIVQPEATATVESVPPAPSDEQPAADKPTAEPIADTPTAAPEPPAKPAADLGDLDAIKKSALDELQPLIEHVEQSPEERFETVMMMIRSNDDPKLIATAHEAAKGIENEKTRANALLNIVSEIEYLKSKASN